MSILTLYIIIEKMQKRNCGIEDRGTTGKLDTTLNREKKLDIPTLGPGEITTLKYKNIPNFMLELDEFKKNWVVVFLIHIINFI